MPSSADQQLREDLAQADADVETLQGIVAKQDTEIELLRDQNAVLHEQLTAIRAKVYDNSLSAKQVVGTLRTWLDRPK